MRKVLKIREVITNNAKFFLKSYLYSIVILNIMFYIISFRDDQLKMKFNGNIIHDFLESIIYFIQGIPYFFIAVLIYSIYLTPFVMVLIIIANKIREFIISYGKKIKK